MTALRRATPGPALLRAAALPALVVTAGVLVLGTASPALAHDGLVGTSPASGSTVTVAPDAVELDFTGEPLPLGTLVAVTGPDGAPTSEGAAEIRGTTVVQALADDLVAGTYRVEWRSSSSDGHALSGSFDFAVETGAAPSAAAVITSAPAAAVSGSAGSADTGLSPVWPVAGAVVAGGLGVALVTRLRRRA